MQIIDRQTDKKTDIPRYVASRGKNQLHLYAMIGEISLSPIKPTKINSIICLK